MRSIPTTKTKEAIMDIEVRAIYRLREDGDYDFVACFGNDEGLWDHDPAETYAEELRLAGEEVLVKRIMIDAIDVLEIEP